MSKLITSVAVAASVVFPMAANATSITYTDANNLEWHLDVDSSAGTATLGLGATKKADLTDAKRAIASGTVVGTSAIPWTFTYENVNYTVTKVAAFAFFELTTMTGPLTIPDAVTAIGANAFASTGLTRLDGCKGVTSWGNYAFFGCSSMVGSFPDMTELTSIGEAPFQDCSSLTGPLKLGDSLTSITRLAFANSYFSGTAVIPESVTTMGYNSNHGVFQNSPNFGAVWVKGKATAASQTYTTVYCAKFAASCTALKMILMGQNTKGARMTQTGSSAMLYGDSGVQVFVPDSGYWNGLVLEGSNNNAWYYGPTNDFNLVVDDDAMRATFTPTTADALTNALAWVPQFKTHFNLDAHVSVTNAIDLTGVTITEDMVSGVTFDRLMFSAKTQTQLDAILGKFPVTTPISIDPTGLTENMVVPDTYTNVYVKTVPGVTIRRTARGFMIVVR